MYRVAVWGHNHDGDGVAYSLQLTEVQSTTYNCVDTVYYTMDLESLIKDMGTIMIFFFGTSIYI